MFKKTRRKIVFAIMSALVLLWAGTLGMIYAFSYMEMRVQNEKMLRAHGEQYQLPQGFEGLRPQGRPFPGGKGGFAETPAFRLTTFYTVALSDDFSVLEIRNDGPTVYTDSDLEALAKQIANGKKDYGTEENLAYYKMDKGSFLLVVFTDNTIINESAMTLIRYTAIFGGLALAVFFFLSVFFAGRIVEPLEENDRKQKQFISDAGHELKTPIAVVSANAELLSRQMGENGWLANIQYENQRMGMLVKSLLELARAEQAQVMCERLDFSRLVSGEALPFESVAFEKGAVLCVDVADGIGVEGNPDRLKQLVSILLDNAIRHGKAGEVCLSLKKEHGFAQLSVVNFGDEIPKEARERLFERFYRTDASRNREGGHYGLGLAIAKAIVTSHKGQIEVKCYDGKVEFRVLIPAV